MSDTDFDRLRAAARQLDDKWGDHDYPTVAIVARLEARVKELEEELAVGRAAIADVGMVTVDEYDRLREALAELWSVRGFAAAVPQGTIERVRRALEGSEK